MRGVVAGWVAAHLGAAALAGAAVATLLVAAAGATPVDLFGTAQPPPLRAMYPGMIALIATVVGQNRLAVLTAGAPRRFGGVRAVWLGVVVAVCWALAQVVQAALHQRAIWVLSVSLSVVVLGLGALWRPLGLVIAAMVEIWSVTGAHAVLLSPDPPGSLLHDTVAAPVIWWAAVGVGAIAYVGRGE